jgi:hypothetical protein
MPVYSGRTGAPTAGKLRMSRIRETQIDLKTGLVMLEGDGRLDAPAPVTLTNADQS